MLRGVIWYPFLADLSKSEKLFEIEPPLATNTIPAKTNEVPLKKPKLEIDVKPKIEADFVVKKESIDEFNKSMDIIDNMNIPVKAEMQNENLEKTNDIPLKKPKLEMDFKPKIETDFVAKKERTDEFAIKEWR